MNTPIRWSNVVFIVALALAAWGIGLLVAYGFYGIYNIIAGGLS